MDSPIYDSLLKKHVKLSHIPVDTSHIIDRFAFEISVAIKSTEFKRMLQDALESFDEIYDCSDSDGDSDKDEENVN